MSDLAINQGGWRERLLKAYARDFPIRRGKLRLVNAVWRSASGDRGTARLAQLNFGGFRMQCDLRDMLQRQFYFFGTYFLEEEILQCWMSAARGSRTVFDVGANAGIYSLAALAAQPDALVHAFEPTPEIAAGLAATARLNNLHQLHVHELAASDNEDGAILHRFRGETGDNEGMNFITASGDDASLERVGTVRLDRFCTERGIDRVDLMKLDVQGHEATALVGAAELIGEGRVGTIFMELNWNSGGPGRPGAQAVDLLSSAGYQFAAPGPRLQWRTPGDWLMQLSDVVARRPHSTRARA